MVDRDPKVGSRFPFLCCFVMDNYLGFFIRDCFKAYYTYEKYLFKDDDTHVFIETNISVAIIFKMNSLVIEIFANQFILSINQFC